MHVMSLTKNRDQYADVPHDVTIKFFRSDVELQAQKKALVAGSTFFGDHFEKVSVLLLRAVVSLS